MSNLENLYKNIKVISVHLEGPRKRKFVGKLERDSNKNYIFTYESKYLNDTKAIPLGPDLPLTKRIHVRSSLFPAFLDRIPEKQNPAYASYCEQFGIDVEENDPFVLLSTIGRRGPSSFVFEPIWGANFGPDELKAWRENLGLSTRDFAEAFGFQQPTIVKIENRKIEGKSILRILDIFFNFPEAAVFYINRYSSNLHKDKKVSLINKLSQNLKSNSNT